MRDRVYDEVMAMIEDELVAELAKEGENARIERHKNAGDLSQSESGGGYASCYQSVAQMSGTEKTVARGAGFSNFRYRLSFLHR